MEQVELPTVSHKKLWDLSLSEDSRVGSPSSLQNYNAQSSLCGRYTDVKRRLCLFFSLSWEGTLITTTVQSVQTLEKRERSNSPLAASINNSCQVPPSSESETWPAPEGGRQTKKGTCIVFHYVTAQVSWQLREVWLRFDSFPFFLRSNFRGFQSGT